MSPHTSNARLYYAHDPMCSWCWAFRPVLTEVLNKIPDSIEVKYLVGGLAPDSQVPMDEETQAMIRHHWLTIIERVPGTRFNFDFWDTNTPKRSTYPACRAVLAAKVQEANKEDAMIHAIQIAYYLDAKNPSNDDTLISCAAGIGLDVKQFQNDLHSSQTEALLKEDLQKVRTMLIRGFPGLVLEKDGVYHSLEIDYESDENMLQHIERAL